MQPTQERNPIAPHVLWQIYIRRNRIAPYAINSIRRFEFHSIISLIKPADLHIEAYLLPLADFFVQRGIGQRIAQ